MRKFKAAAALSMLSAALLLTGCSGTNLYTTYTDVENMALIQTVGIDRGEGGSVEVTAGSGIGLSGAAPILFEKNALSLSGALNELRLNSNNMRVYFAHTEHFLIGEDCARDGIGPYIDFIMRNLSLRMNLSVYVVRGARARDIMYGVLDTDSSVSDMLNSIREDEMKDNSFTTSGLDIASSLAKNGCALVMMLEPVETGDMTGGSSQMLVPMGFAVIKDGSLAGYIDGDAGMGTAIMNERFEFEMVKVELPQDVEAVLGITEAERDVEPVTEDGELTGYRIRVKAKADVEELSGEAADLEDAEMRRQLEERLEALLEDRVRKSVEIASELEADVLLVGQEIDMKAPELFDAVREEWPELFPTLPYEVEAEVTVVRTYDATEPISMTGRNNKE